MDNYTFLKDPATAQPPAPQFGGTGDDARISAFPKNEIFLDGFQGETLLRPKPHLLELGYNNQDTDPEEFHAASMIHCEAEGDFWVRMDNIAVAFGALATVLTAATAVTTMAGAAAGAGSAVILGAVAQSQFDANPGEVEDANLGDRKLDRIQEGSRVAVFGEHVYDGFHAGWHEIHPLMAVEKVEPDTLDDAVTSEILTWDPDFRDGEDGPKGLPADDMRRGLESTRLADEARAVLTRWCDHLRAAFDGQTRQKQQGLEHRWTVHPTVDGCRPPATEGDGDRSADTYRLTVTLGESAARPRRAPRASWWTRGGSGRWAGRFPRWW